MERARVRPAVLLALAALLLLPFAVPDARAGAHRPLQRTGGVDANLSILASIVSGNENTSAMVQNRGTANGTIAMDIYTSTGILVSGAGQVFTNVPPGGTRWFPQVSNMGLATTFRGVGVISSDQLFNALLIRDIKDGQQKSYSVVNAYPVGANKVTLPFILNNLNGRHTRFTIANAGTTVACVTIVYSFKAGLGSVPTSGKDPLTASGPGGSPCASGQYRIPVSGQLSFAPTTIDGAIAMPAETNNAMMAVTITATNAPITASVDAYGGSAARRLGSYDGFVIGASESTTDDIGLDIVVPIVLKSASGWYSQILLSNPNNAQANGTITYNGTVDGTPVAPIVVPITVPANGIESQSVYHVESMPVGFIGAATVKSNQPLAAVLFRMKMTSAESTVEENHYTAVSGVPTDRATTKVRLPLIFRRVSASGSNSGYNSWVSVSVANGGTATVTIQAIPDPTAPSCGGGSPSSVTRQVTGSYVFYQLSNTAGENGFQTTPACFWGGMTITSNVPIVAIANVTNNIYPGDNEGLYNGFAE